MVRSLVGALVPVGDGREDVEFPRRALEKRDRLAQVVTMPAHGLVLEKVLYPPDDLLQARQDITRARRELMDVD
jgi:tRNA pseudouridine38-40 synthase